MLYAILHWLHDNDAALRPYSGSSTVAYDPASTVQLWTTSEILQSTTDRAGKKRTRMTKKDLAMTDNKQEMSFKI